MQCFGQPPVVRHSRGPHPAAHLNTRCSFSVQALPYCWTLLFIPMHFMTFELLLLATGLWTTNIHDTVDGKVRVQRGLWNGCVG